MSLETDARLLGGIKIFSLLEHEAIKMLAFQAETIEHQEGDILFDFGDKSIGGLVVKSGKVLIESVNAEPDQDLKTNKIVGQGALIGQLALITDVTHRAQARATEITAILQIQRNSFQRILREYPDCAAKIRSEIASDLLQFTKALQSSSKLAN